MGRTRRIERMDGWNGGDRWTDGTNET